MSTPNDLGTDQFSLHVEHSDGTCIVRLLGELDYAHTDEVKEALRQAEDGADATILIDIDGLRFIDSGGLALLLEASRRSGESGRIRMTRGTGHVAKMLRLTGLDQTLPFAHDVQT